MFQSDIQKYCSRTQNSEGIPLLSLYTPCVQYSAEFPFYIPDTLVHPADCESVKKRKEENRNDVTSMTISST